MAFIELHDLKEERPIPGFGVKFVHSANMTFAHWTIGPNAVLPEHTHPHEQVMNIIEGRFQLTIDGETRVLGPGSVAIIPSEAVHSGRALSYCRVLDVFYPIREDYKE